MKTKRLAAALLATVLPFTAFGGVGYAEESASARTPEQILAGMTTEEKVAQMLMPEFKYYTDEKARGMT